MSRYVNGTGGGLQNTSYPSSASSGSISMWIQPQWSSGDSATHVFMSFSSDGSHDAPTFQKFSDNNIYAGFAGFPAGEQRIIIADTGHFLLGRWDHWVFTWANGGNSFLYRNGVQVGTRAGITANGQAGKVTLENYFDFADTFNSNFFIAEVAYWNAQLTADEAGYLGQGGHIGNVRTANIISYWPLKGTASPEPDVVGGFNLTLTGVTSGPDPPLVDRTPAREEWSGPAQIGAPWGQKVFVTNSYGSSTTLPPPTITASGMFAREVTTGPPLRGAPWAQRLFVESDIPPPAPPPPPTSGAMTQHIGEVTKGPPLRGAPFAQRLFVEPTISPPAPAPPAPPATPNSYAREVFTGPPMRGAPFAQRLFVEPTPFQSPPGQQPTPTPVGVKGKPFLERVPDIQGPAAEDRRRRQTELLSIIINSLVRKGELVQTGISDFDIFAAGVIPVPGKSILTGQFDDGTFSEIAVSGTFTAGNFAGPAPGATYTMGTFP